MIVVFLQSLREVSPWDAVGGYVVRGLDVEGLFDLGVRSDEEMDDDENGDQGIEEDVCDRELTHASLLIQRESNYQLPSS
jgi:hypothetical protein